MINFLTSFGASSNFDKHRLIVTTKTLDSPNEYSLNKLMNTFKGQDEQTRSQIAFAIIIKKIISSESKYSWIYLLKNLIILDKIIDEGLFLNELTTIKLNTIDQYVEIEKKYLDFTTNFILQLYWKMIQNRSQLLLTYQHIFSLKRNKRDQYINNLSLKYNFKFIESIHHLFRICFHLIQTISFKDRKDLLKMNKKSTSFGKQIETSKLIQYLKLQLLYKLMNFYSSQLLCVNKFIQSLLQVGDKQLQYIRKYRLMIIQFKNHSKSIIEFVQQNKNISGFEVISYKELNPFQNYDIIKIVDQYILQYEHNKSSENILSPLKLQTIQNWDLNVEKKPYGKKYDGINIPRKTIQSQIQYNVYDSFENWTNSYSSQFPQKQIMTFDLIMTLKKKQTDQQAIIEQPIVYSHRQSCVFNSSQAKMYNKIQYIKTQDNEKHYIQQTDDSNNKDINIFSELNYQWNQQ